MFFPTSHGLTKNKAEFPRLKLWPHAKWTKTNIIQYYSYVEYKKKKMAQMNLFHNRSRVADVENKLMATRKRGRRDKPRGRDWRIHIHTIIYKI